MAVSRLRKRSLDRFVYTNGDNDETDLSISKRLGGRLVVLPSAVDWVERVALAEGRATALLLSVAFVLIIVLNGFEVDGVEVGAAPFDTTLVITTEETTVQSVGGTVVRDEKHLQNLALDTSVYSSSTLTSGVASSFSFSLSSSFESSSLMAEAVSSSSVEASSGSPSTGEEGDGDEDGDSASGEGFVREDLPPPVRPFQTKSLMPPNILIGRLL
jgi:hypothetical protein